MLTRREWIIRRFYQGHRIEICEECGFSIPKYIGIFYHIFITGHDNIREVNKYARQESST